jgi:hypothetical protein
MYFLCQEEENHDSHTAFILKIYRICPILFFTVVKQNKQEFLLQQPAKSHPVQIFTPAGTVLPTLDIENDDRLGIAF